MWSDEAGETRIDKACGKILHANAGLLRSDLVFIAQDARNAVKVVFRIEEIPDPKPDILQREELAGIDIDKQKLIVDRAGFIAFGYFDDFAGCDGWRSALPDPRLPTIIGMRPMGIIVLDRSTKQAPPVARATDGARNVKINLESVAYRDRNANRIMTARVADQELRARLLVELPSI